jgi:hypothetical protein
MVTRMSLHCQTCCQGWKRDGGGGISSSAARAAVAISNAAVPAKSSFFTFVTPFNRTVRHVFVKHKLHWMRN